MRGHGRRNKRKEGIDTQGLHESKQKGKRRERRREKKSYGDTWSLWCFIYSLLPQEAPPHVHLLPWGCLSYPSSHLSESPPTPLPRCSRCRRPAPLTRLLQFLVVLCNICLPFLFALLSYPLFPCLYPPLPAYRLSFLANSLPLLVSCIPVTFPSSSTSLPSSLPPISPLYEEKPSASHT